MFNSHFTSPRRRFAINCVLGVTTLFFAAPVLFAVAQGTTPTSQNKLAGTQWQLVVPDWNLGTKARLKASTLRFDASRISASVGCNALGGSYTAQGSTLKVGPFISTRMACGTPLDSYENRYSAALSTATKWQLSRDGQILLIQTAKEPLVFARQTSAGLKPTTR